MELLRVAFIGTYPPTQCGIATFTAALRKSMAPGIDLPASPVIRVRDPRDASTQSSADDAVLEWVHGVSQGLDEVVRAIDEVDVLVVNHEYGIFGGPEGSAIVELLDRVSTPAIAVLHTVQSDPTPLQRTILEAIAERVDAVVAQSQAARRRLLRHFAIDPNLVDVIPHGAAPNFDGPTERLTEQPLVLTWGLIGPGKGLECAIDAMALLDDLDPAPVYLIAGETHPKVRATDGERYRSSLQRRVEARGISGRVRFDARYRDLDELGTLIRSCDIVLLPYESRDQITSGVLVEALASGKPVVATAFPHAREVLASGAGDIVSHDDPAAMASGLRAFLEQPERAELARQHARRIGQSFFWPSVGAAYIDLARRVRYVATPPLIALSS
jgi:glycosyltransferase involved in cell wall biosynthesis